MSKKVVLLTANTGGGIVQFAVQLYHVLTQEGFSVKLCAPAAARNTSVGEVPPEDIIFYDKVKSVFDNAPYKPVADRICREEPDYVLHCDDSIVCLKIGLCIKEKKVKQLLTVHDAGGYHPSNQVDLRTRLVQAYNRWNNWCFSKKAHSFVLLSPESAKTFRKRFPHRADRVVQMPLGAHIPQEEEVRPQEMACLKQGGYLLFFGRIDKYKGVGTLLKAYRQIADTALPLVIAGNGKLSPEEQELLQTTNNALLINRYIGDGEMKWLFANSTAVVLPYIEATQSGVIPIAYAYGKPVIVSKLPGLTQFVEDQETGVVCANEDAWIRAIQSVTDGCFAEKRKAAILRYYKENLDWNQNIKRIFSEDEIGNQ